MGTKKYAGRAPQTVEELTQNPGAAREDLVKSAEATRSIGAGDHSLGRKIVDSEVALNKQIAENQLELDERALGIETRELYLELTGKEHEKSNNVIDKHLMRQGLKGGESDNVEGVEHDADVLRAGMRKDESERSDILTAETLAAKNNRIQKLETEMASLVTSLSTAGIFSRKKIKRAIEEKRLSIEEASR